MQFALFCSPPMPGGNPLSSLINWLSGLFGSRSPPPVLEDPVEPVGFLFNIEIDEIYKDETRLKDNIPLPLYNTAEALQNFLTVEGLFRVSGIFSEMKKMKDAFEASSPPDLINVQSIHSIAGLQEMWFRELAEPVTTHALYDEFMDCADGGEEKVNAEKLATVVAKLPGNNRTTLAFFLRFMVQIATLEEENKMGAANLGVVFGGVLLGSKIFSFSLDMKQKIVNQNLIIQALISSVDDLFPLQDFPFPW